MAAEGMSTAAAAAEATATAAPAAGSRWGRAWPSALRWIPTSTDRIIAAEKRLLSIVNWGGSSRPDFTCKSTEETEAWFIDSFEEWRKAKNLSNFILLGHSFGGYVAAKYALQHPEHVQHLILVGPAGFSSETEHSSEWLTKFRATWKGMLVNHLWESNFTPQRIVRGLGPWGPGLVQRYTSARFGSHSTGELLTEQESTLLTDYIYHTLAAKASGELCLKHIFSFGAFVRKPLLQRSYEHPGDLESICTIGGHFVFIDNPSGFHSAVFHACRKFLSGDGEEGLSLPEGLTSA
ncbi:hypothetical protein OsJ_30042 [Oryza sativa Japonica Group]|uniref:AB hydrolase-1 domain-containing protein n=1 Tax=Oryza sativa subsp. japonica TaxID=39947 RepID=A3C0Q4_ORYSJ|nr:hypothetical protein OsJ_30042 [Oryza sativa Japonica Group]